jgi:hypothetical protein
MPMKRLVKVILLATVAVFMLSGWAVAEVRLIKGQTLYVPCYTTFYSGGHPFEVTTVIYIHNADPKNAINIVKIALYNTSGKLVEKYLQKPLKLDAFATHRINVKAPLEGEEGSGANFIIQWQADKKVVVPLINALFLGARGTQGYSFTSPARVIKEESD